MPQVVISFLAGEVLYAETPEITFDLPAIEAQIENVDANSERALIPTTAIRQIMVGDVPVRLLMPLADTDALSGGGAG